MHNLEQINAEREQVVAKIQELQNAIQNLQVRYHQLEGAAAVLSENAEGVELGNPTIANT